jgi:hypothetical protein
MYLSHISHHFNGNVNSFKTNEDFCKWLISRDHKGYNTFIFVLDQSRLF